MHPTDDDGVHGDRFRRRESEPQTDPLEAALRALPVPAADDGEAFTAAVMRRIAREAAHDLTRDTTDARATWVPAAHALQRAQSARVRAARRARWIGASVLVGTAVGAGISVALADSALPATNAWLSLGIRPAAAAAALVVLLSWAALRGGLR